MNSFAKKIVEFIYKHRYDLTVLTLIALAGAVVFEYRDKFDVFSDRETFQNFINSFGHWGPIAIIGSVVLEVIVAPIPGYIPAITAGFIFGPILGSIYTYIGNVIGTMIVFFVARKCGKKIIERFIKKDRLEKYEKTITRHENYLLVFYFFPIVPIDIISAAFGLSKIHFKKFFFVSSIGFVLYSIVSTNFGDYLAQLWF